MLLRLIFWGRGGFRVLTPTAEEILWGFRKCLEHFFNNHCVVITAHQFLLLDYNFLPVVIKIVQESRHPFFNFLNSGIHGRISVDHPLAQVHHRRGIGWLIPFLRDTNHRHRKVHGFIGTASATMAEENVYSRRQ
jgi:hypothetical protein